MSRDDDAGAGAETFIGVWPAKPLPPDRRGSRWGRRDPFGLGRDHPRDTAQVANSPGSTRAVRTSRERCTFRNVTLQKGEPGVSRRMHDHWGRATIAQGSGALRTSNAARVKAEMTLAAIATWSDQQPKERWLPCHRPNQRGGAAKHGGLDSQRLKKSTKRAIHLSEAQPKRRRSRRDKGRRHPAAANGARCKPTKTEATKFAGSAAVGGSVAGSHRPLGCLVHSAPKLEPIVIPTLGMTARCER